ncbi:hypothetical protein KDL01_36370 [Actinospica durhamensis]|uniref:Uncharacterized protein n=1 Tax=Actinospica durhamensis TaxID=1508375 RepID=A0A941IRH3_9ACTN|nr:hypothetical protein [Actinospica durhamensis]MBR7838800.1 hypothetical protein [Actinospica durhamensis]
MSKSAIGITLLSAAVLGAAAACAGPAPASNPTTSAASASPSPATTAAAPEASGITATFATATSATATSATSLAAATWAPKPGTYVAGAWLAVEQMPLYRAGVTAWAYNTFNYGTRLGGHVYLSPAGHLTDWCDEEMSYSGDLTGLEKGLAGSQYQAFTGPNSDKVLPNGTIPYLTAQSAYFYGGAAEAQAAMDGLAADFAGCAARGTGTDPTTGSSLVATTERTVAQSGAECWSLLFSGRSSTRNGGTLDHDCFVRSGDVIEEVHLHDNEDGSFTTQSFAAVDSTLISELRQDLRAYPGN